MSRSKTGTDIRVRALKRLKNDKVIICNILTPKIRSGKEIDAEKLNPDSIFILIREITLSACLFALKIINYDTCTILRNYNDLQSLRARRKHVPSFFRHPAKFC